jgi:hypothetical protein
MTIYMVLIPTKGKVSALEDALDHCHHTLAALVLLCLSCERDAILE